MRLRDVEVVFPVRQAVVLTLNQFPLSLNGPGALDEAVCPIKTGIPAFLLQSA